MIWLETWCSKSSGWVWVKPTETLFGMKHTKKTQKTKEQCTNISTSIYRESQVFFEEGIKSWSLSLSNPGFCFGVLICLSRSQRMSLCFLVHALLLNPTLLGNSPFFSVFLSLNFPPPSSSSSFFSFFPKYLSHPFCPSCPLARSEVETCVSLHLHGEKGRKVKSDLSLSPSLQRGADRLAPSMELSLTLGRLQWICYTFTALSN